MKKRVLSLLLALILLLSCVPQQVFAARIAENLPAEEAAVLPSAWCYAFLSNLFPQPLQVIVILPTPRGTRRRFLHCGQVK